MSTGNTGEILTTQQVATRYDRSVDCIRRMAQQRRLPGAFKLPGDPQHWYFRLDELRAFERRRAADHNASTAAR